MLALLMQEYRLSVVNKDQESKEQAKKRVSRIVKDCNMQMLLRMRDAVVLKLNAKRRVSASYSLTRFFKHVQESQWYEDNDRTLKVVTTAGSKINSYQ
jgi:hypothetical protein